MLRKNTVVIEVTDDSVDQSAGDGHNSNKMDSLSVPAIKEENSDEEIEYEDEGG